MAERDYDAARGGDTLDMSDEILPGELHARRAALQSGLIDEDTDVGEPVDLPGADASDLPGLDLDFRVKPRQHDEFTCSYCFLVLHRSRLAPSSARRLRCRDCA